MYAGDVPGSLGGEQRLHDRALTALRAGVRPALRQHAAHLAQRAQQPLRLPACLGRLLPGALSLLPAAQGQADQASESWSGMRVSCL